MKYLALTLEGLEDIAQQEIKEKTKSIAKVISKTVLEFETTKDLTEVSFQSLTRLIKFLGTGNFKSKPNFKDLDFSSIKEPFRVVCERQGVHDFNSLTIEQELGALIVKKFKKTVNIRVPECVIYVYIRDNSYFIGEDFLKKDLTRREYKLKTSAVSLNSCIVYGAIRLSGYKKDHILLDPLCRNSEILIEAGLYVKGKLIGLDSNYANIKNSKLNAKIAGIELELHHGDLDWVETKVKPDSVDEIITVLMLREYKDVVRKLFEQAMLVLKKQGKLVIVCNKIIPEHQDFKLVKQCTVNKGTSYYILVFQKE